MSNPFMTKTTRNYRLLMIGILFLIIFSLFSSQFVLNKSFTRISNASAAPLTPFVSSTTTFSGWQKENLIDGISSYNHAWSSALHTDSPDHIEWAAVSVGDIKSISKIVVSPSPNLSTFPHNFTIQYSTDLANWIDIPIHRYTNYTAPTNQNPITFSFSPVQATGIRLIATKLGRDASGNYALQLGEIQVDVSDADLRLYSSLDDSFDAQMTNYYQQFALAQNQKNYSCNGTEIGANLTWSVSYSGEGSAFLSKFSWDENKYKNEILRMLFDLPVDSNGLVWDTTSNRRHLDNHLLYESNAHFILSAWDYLKWTGNANIFKEINDRSLIVKTSDNAQVINNSSCDYTQRVSIAHTIGQKFTSSKPVSEIKLWLLALGGVDGKAIQKCSNLNDPLCSELTNYQITITSANGATVYDKKYAGIDKCSDGDCTTLNGWVTIPVNLQAGTYHIDLKNLGRIDIPNYTINSSDYYLSPLGWCSSFRNVFGSTTDKNDNVATINRLPLSILEKVRKAMAFQTNIMKGQDGIIIIDDSVPDGAKHKGRPSFQPFFQTEDTPSNFWDLIRFGYKDGYINTFYYGSLEAIADLEDMLGNTRERDSYRAIMPTVKNSYSDNFWAAATGRFISNIDVNGVKQDIGHTPQNLLAVYYGLTDKTQAGLIMNWIGGTRIVAGDTSIGSDIYKFKFAPRTNTKAIETTQTKNGIWFEGDNRTGFTNPERWIWNFKPDGTGQANFGNQEENGGSDLFFAFHDIVNRARINGANDSWPRYKTLIEEFNKDGFYRKPDITCTYKKHMLAGPESGLPSLSFMEAFIGIKATVAGLEVNPNLPSELTMVGIKRVYHLGYTYDIEVSKSAIIPTINQISNTYFKVVIPASSPVVIYKGSFKNNSLNCPNRSQGDADCNGKIELLDFVCWKYEFINKIILSSCKSANFDSTNPIGIIDYAIWLKYFQVEN